MGVKHLPHLSLYATAIERIIVVLGTISLNFYTKCHVVSKGIRFLALLKKFVKERKRRACFHIIYFSPKNLPVQVNKAESSLFVREKKKTVRKGILVIKKDSFLLNHSISKHG